MRKSREERRVVKMVGKSQGAAMKGFQLVLSLILLSFQGIQVKATETSSIHFVKEMGKEADSFGRKEVWIKAKISREDPVSPPPPFDRISSSSLKEMVCRSVEAGWNEKANKKSNRQGKDPKTQKETSQGEGPEYLAALGSRWQEAGEVAHSWWRQSLAGERGRDEGAKKKET